MSDSTADRETRKAMREAVWAADNAAMDNETDDNWADLVSDAVVGVLAAQQWLINLVRLAHRNSCYTINGVPVRGGHGGSCSAVPEPFRSAAGIGDDPR